MTSKELIIRESGVPHSPYHLVDENENFIATIHLSENSKEYAVLFSQSKKMGELLLKVLEENSNHDVVSLELNTEITKILNQRPIIDY